MSDQRRTQTECEFCYEILPKHKDNCRHFLGEQILTVVIRNDAPLMYASDSPTYRTVHLKFTPEQLEQLRFWQKEEEISKCWIEREVTR